MEKSFASPKTTQEVGGAMDEVVDKYSNLSEQIHKEFSVNDIYDRKLREEEYVVGFKRHINEVLESRSEEKNSFMNTKELRRSSGNQIRLASRADVTNQHFLTVPGVELLQNIKTKDLKRTYELLDKYELTEFSRLLDLLKTEFKERYPVYSKMIGDGSTNIYTLSEEDIEYIRLGLSNIQMYSVRKINELLCYRASTEIPKSANIEEYVKFINSLAHSTGKERDVAEYRKHNIKSFKAVDAEQLSDAMNKFNELVSKEEKTNDAKLAIQKSLAYYCLFEIIHPFFDGNGRTGRALFVHLQKRFNTNNLLKPYHIPIGHKLHSVKSETTQYTSDEGSLNPTVGVFLKKILQSESVNEFFKNIEDVSPEELTKRIDALYIAIGSKTQELGNMAEAIVENSKIETLTDINWDVYSKKLKEVLSFSRN